MTPAEHHELQLRRMALVLDAVNPTAAKVLREAADFIRQSAPSDPK